MDPDPNEPRGICSKFPKRDLSPDIRQKPVAWFSGTGNKLQNSALQKLCVCDHLGDKESDIFVMPQGILLEKFIINLFFLIIESDRVWYCVLNGGRVGFP